MQPKNAWTALAAICLCYASDALADRVLYLPSLGFSTNHAGLLKDAGGIFKNNISADSLGAAGYDSLENPVVFGRHEVEITLQNLSPTEEVKVEVHFLSDSNVASWNSSGAGNIWPSFAGPKHSLAVTRIVELTLGKLASGTATMLSACGAQLCQTAFACSSSPSCSLVAAADINGPAWSLDNCAASGNSNQAGVKVTSYVYMQIHVKSDRGAILGSLRTGATRCGGYIDRHHEPFPTQQLNGGRPF